MFESALNPLAWWGLLAVSVPIVIHLINRLRYRRVRWAAMEFLLKSQQRNRRKLILEQLLLLLLRCLLVALVVALIARPTWFLGEEGRGSDWPTHHVFLLDDSLSMRDLAAADAPEGETAFRTGTKLLADLAAQQADAGGAHYWTVLRWTDPSQPEVGKAMPTETSGAGASGEEPLGQQLQRSDAAALKERLDALRCSYLPASPLAAVKQAALRLSRVKEGHRMLHVISDFRRTDWLDAQADELHQLLSDLARQKIRIRLHDVARPSRSPSPAEAPPAHGNLGITEIAARARRRADSAPAAGAANANAGPALRVVTPRLPFDVHASVRNFSEAERRQVRVGVSVGGVDKGSRVIDRLPGGSEVTVVFNLEFAPDEAAGLRPIAVRIDDPDRRDHLPEDNVRFTFVELRKEAPVLLVDGDLRSEKPADAYFLSAAFTATARTGLRVERISPRELAKRQDLASFAVVWLLDVAGVGKGEADLEPEGLALLERYVRDGGCAVFALGPRTNVVAFNERFFRGGEGVFPAPLMARPDPEGRSALPFRDEAPDERDLSPKVRFAALSHPALPFEGDLVDLLSRYMNVNRWWRVEPSWQPPKSTQTLLRLANRRPLAFYVDEAKELAEALERIGGPESGKLRPHAEAVRAALTDADAKRGDKGALVDAIAALLGDKAIAGVLGQQKELRARLEKFQALIQDGDPLLLEAAVGAGQVAALLTPAAPIAIQGKEYAWNNLASGDLGQFFFVPFVLSLQSHLAALSSATGDRRFARLVGESYELVLDKERHQQEVEVWFQANDAAAPQRVNVLNAEAATVLGADGVKRQVWRASLTASRGPGFYRIRLNQPKSDGATPVQGEISLNPQAAGAKAGPEERPLIFNVDNRREGALGRFAESDLREKLAAGLNQGPAKLSAAEAQAFVEGRTWFQLNPLAGDTQEQVKSSSWSDYSFVLLAFMVLLLLEQRLAMRFSHLTR